VSSRYLALTLALLLATLGRLLWPASLTPPGEEVREQLLGGMDAESLLARGERIELSAAGIYELLLIPGIGDTLAGRIVLAKGEVYAHSLLLPAARKHEALTAVHGVGPKGARAISRWLDPTR